MCGGGPDPEDFNKPTEAEKAQAEVAANQFNEYLKGKAIQGTFDEQGRPTAGSYLEDIYRDPALTAKATQGEAAVDLAQMTPAVSNPNAVNGGMSPTGSMRLAGRRAKVMTDLSQDAVSQQAAGKKAFVENAMGLQSSADTAQAGMAADAVRRNITSAEADYESSTAGTRSLTSLAGAGAGMALAMNRKPAQ